MEEREASVREDSGEAGTAEGPDAELCAGVPQNVCSQRPPFHVFDKLKVC